jgi:hypothetical protein
MRNEQLAMSSFKKGLITGFVAAIIIFGAIGVIMYNHFRDRRIVEYAERQQVIEDLREDYLSRDPYEFIESIPGVSGAVDGAAADFIRKRNEVVERFRTRLSSRARHTD